MDSFEELFSIIDSDTILKKFDFKQKKVCDEYCEENKIIKLEIDKIEYKLSKDKGLLFYYYYLFEEIKRDYSLISIADYIVPELKRKILLLELVLDIPPIFYEDLIKLYNEKERINVYDGKTK